MKTKNLLGIKIKCNNSREENIIEIIKGQVKNFYSDFVNKPYIVEEHYNILYGQISSLLHLALINPSEFIIISNRLLTVYRFTELKSRKYK